MINADELHVLIVYRMEPQYRQKTTSHIETQNFFWFPNHKHIFIIIMR